MQIAMILKLLDMVHDYLLCPFFGDKKDIDYSKIIEKLDNITQQIESLKNGKHS